ncbi:TetR/AcrR family transcriptional regulator [Paenibacillus polysaccharolyticus]|uniref:TetR/AcrR family transcriptional regulator n=1 Tax=Paenibacillus cucumis (ex Kampfer et al. 2016) TaxID=1776858 RepID=A0ABS7KS71_9BACL|nr:MULTISPECIES: TetR/AcrR family transcriptional regulator [Paenibacillus]MBY0206990.1 TetR/AcrR family transcriptional regulator [Paenibacillus cucumis (ex Kampfer et al. 2016)]MCP1131862.1 TetR/AcrR family transcriptional regulator [Paenibacillus polysaccharolyticus]MDP9701697.1 AcrR family transcriptional regulator [Paenibacillus intestini]
MAKVNGLGPGEERRDQIIRIAMERFATQGYHQTKISDIVREAGVAQGTFYWHFKSKEAIASEILLTGREQLLEAIGQGYRKDAGSVEDMVKASEKLFTNLFTFAAQNRYFMELLLKGIVTEESVQRLVEETRNAVETAFRHNMERAIELGMLPADMNVPLRAALLVSMIEGMISRWLFGSDALHSRFTEMSATALAAEAASFEFYGLLGT